MSNRNPSNKHDNRDLHNNSILNTAEQNGASLNRKSAGKVQDTDSALSKGDSRYWTRRGKLKKHKSANYSFQVGFKGHRLTFSTRTGNKEAAAKIAAGIYRDLVNTGIEATVAKHRPEAKKSERVATVGEWIAAASGVSESNPATFTSYARALRKITGDVLAVKRSRKRFGPRSGGAASYRAKIDGAPLDILTPATVQKWRLAYVKRATNPAQERSRMTSCNSTIRQARSLFAGKVVRFLPDLRLPDPQPFMGIEFFPRQSAKYFSRIDPKELLQQAQTELASTDQPAFTAMLLALAAGLRRGEIDGLCWHQVDFDRQLIRVEPTERAGLKTSDSRDEVPIDEHVTAVLRGHFANGKRAADYVIEGDGGAGGQKKWGQHYRADAVFERLTIWLRKHGVAARKPLHELRKELGALVTAEHGIYAASRVLRHSNVATTAAHYTDLKTRPVVNVGSWLNRPENITSITSEEKLTGSKRQAKAAVK
jgi:integrase